MQVTVKYMAQLKQAAGTGRETVEVTAGCTVPTLLRDLAGKRPDAFRRIVLDAQGNLQPCLLFFVHEEQVRPEEQRELRDGDVVTVLAPMAGG